jgi:protein SDA1
LSQNQVFSALAIAYVNGLLPFSNITYVNKNRKHDKESRVATILEGRKDRGKFGQRFKDSNLGKSNKEKKKNKSFMMVRHKINRKTKRSFKDKQIALRNSLIKRKMK